MPFRTRQLEALVGHTYRARVPAQEAGLLLVTRKDNEDGEGLLRRFNKMVQRDGILQEARRRRSFISNREKQRQAERRAARRRRRQAMKLTRRR